MIKLQIIKITANRLLPFRCFLKVGIVWKDGNIMEGIKWEHNLKSCCNIKQLDLNMASMFFF